MGDSGFVVVRKGKVLFRSPPQQHEFNFPYQLGQEGSDTPRDAQVAPMSLAVMGCEDPGGLGFVGGLLDLRELRRLNLVPFRCVQVFCSRGSGRKQNHI